MLRSGHYVTRLIVLYNHGYCIEYVNVATSKLYYNELWAYSFTRDYEVTTDPNHGSNLVPF